MTQKVWHTKEPSLPGADPEILVRGGDYFFKGIGSGAGLSPPVGPGQRPGWDSGGKAPGNF